MLNIFEPEVSCVTAGLKGKSILLYGGNRTGKTQNCAAASKSVFLRFENGLNALSGVRSFPITKWTDYTAIVKQLTSPVNAEKAHEMYETIVIDTIDRMLALGEEYICGVFGVVGVDRDSTGKKGYGVWREYRAEVSKWINMLTNAGYTVIFIGHDDVRTLQNDRGEEYNKIYPRGDRRSVDFIADICDIIAYACNCCNDENGNPVKSTLYLDGTSAFLAGSRFPKLVPAIPEWDMAKLEAAVSAAVTEGAASVGASVLDYDTVAKAKNEAAKEAENSKIPLSELVAAIGAKVANMVAVNGNKDAYDTILEEELGNRDFRAQEATEKQREQLEQILAALNERGY